MVYNKHSIISHLSSSFPSKLSSELVTTSSGTQSGQSTAHVPSSEMYIAPTSTIQ